MQNHKKVVSSKEESAKGDDAKSLSPFSSTSSLEDIPEGGDDASASFDRTRSSIRRDSDTPLQRNASFFTPQNLPQSQLIKIAISLLQAVSVRPSPLHLRVLAVLSTARPA
jgi:hypothetical protein